MMRILLVDNDESLMKTLSERLIQQRYAVDIALDGETAQEFLALFTYDLIVLDLLLPDIEGISLCQQFRKQGVHTPILMLTAKDGRTDKIHALDAGADDYVVKPFDFDELCARIRALLRRDNQVGTASLTWGELCLNPNTFEVCYGEHPLHTTPKEYALLEMFLRHTHRVFSLDAIIENLWSFEDPPSDDAVRTHIKGLRQKLKAGGAPKDLIETVYGLGYRLKPLAKVTTTPSQAFPTSDSQTATTQKRTQPEITSAIAKAWTDHQNTMQKRLKVLETTTVALDTGQLSEELQHAGRSQAHKLAGSLGCFGFVEGARLARKLEHLLTLDTPFDKQLTSQVSALVHSLHQSLNHNSRHQVCSTAITGIPQVLLLGTEQSFLDHLTAEALAVGINSVTVHNSLQAQTALQTQPPDGVLLQLDEDNLDDAVELLAAIAQYSDTIPVLSVTELRDFHQRLQLVQQGVDRILPAATSPQHVIAVMQQMLQVANTAFKVIIVDDDTHVLKLLRTILSPWGLQLTTLDHPAQLWTTLEIVQPDLLVLDVEMSEANGLELCQVLRADERWQQLPILFLTVHEDHKTQQQAFSVGADDIISKSAMTADLANRIFNRLRRSPQSYWLT